VYSNRAAMPGRSESPHILPKEPESAPETAKKGGDEQ